MSEVIFVLIVVVVLLVALFFLLLYISKRINLLMKDNFVSKVSELDFLIEDKEKKLEELNVDVSNQQKHLLELEEKMEEMKNNESGSSSGEDVVLPKYADFEDGNLLSGYKIIKKYFDIDANKVISDFVDQLDDNSKNAYEVLTNIRQYFSYDVIYRISSYQAKEQFIIISDLLSDEEKEIVSDLLNVKRFNIKRFVDEIDDLILKNNPIVYVYVGDKNKNYNKIDSRIQTIYDERITEGFRIVYKGIVHDFSI